MSMAYNREEALANSAKVPFDNVKLFGINEAIIAGKGIGLPLFSARERAMAYAYAGSKLSHQPSTPPVIV